MVESNDNPLSNAFHDAMKKVATTKVDPAILIEEVEKKYEIPDAEGKNVILISLGVMNLPVSGFTLGFHLEKLLKPDEPPIISGKGSITFPPDPKLTETTIREIPKQRNTIHVNSDESL